MAGTSYIDWQEADPSIREGRRVALLGGLAGTLGAILFFQWLLDPFAAPAPAARVELPPVPAAVEARQDRESAGQPIRSQTVRVTVPSRAAQQPAADRTSIAASDQDDQTYEESTALTAHAVQVGAFFSPQEAEQGWRNVLGAASDLLAELPRQTVEAETGTAKGTVYRLRIGPFTQAAQAKSLCADLQARGLGCFLAKPIATARTQEPDSRPVQQTAFVVDEAALAIDPVLGTLREKPTDPDQLSFVINGVDLEVLKPKPPIDSAPIEPAAIEAAPAEAELAKEIPPEPVEENETHTAALAASTPVVAPELVPRGPRRAKVSPIERETYRERAVKSGLLYKGKPARSVVGTQYAQAGASDEGGSRLSDEPKPFLGEGDIPDRAPLLLELGNPFLETGELDSGFELPTGAVWQPRLWVFGTLRTAVQVIDTGDNDRVSEWANRFDLFANLQLTGTEKAVLGIRPFDSNRPDQFSGYRFESTGNDSAGWENGTVTKLDDLNQLIRTAFVEGDFGSLFPNLDPVGTSLLDFGFTVGRQPIVFQDGILISDTLDAAGIVRNNIRLPGVSNLRISGLYGSDLFNETTRSNTGVPVVDDEDLQLVGLFTEWDTPISTFNLDGAYVWDDTRADGDGIYGGLSAAQRFGPINTTFRILGSKAHGDETTLVRDGILVTGETSWTPTGTNDTLYFNPFFTYGEYVQAARERVDGGGPLAALGILFASPNIGRYGSEISNRTNDVAGAALGYQWFWDDNRRNLALEFAVRKELGLKRKADTFNSTDQYAVGAQFQQAIGQRLLLQLESYYAYQRDQDNAYGARAELLYQF